MRETHLSQTSNHSNVNLLVGGGDGQGIVGQASVLHYDRIAQRQQHPSFLFRLSERRERGTNREADTIGWAHIDLLDRFGRKATLWCCRTTTATETCGRRTIVATPGNIEHE